MRRRLGSTVGNSCGCGEPRGSGSCSERRKAQRARKRSVIPRRNSAHLRAARVIPRPSCARFLPRGQIGINENFLAANNVGSAFDGRYRTCGRAGHAISDTKSSQSENPSWRCLDRRNGPNETIHPVLYALANFRLRNSSKPTAAIITTPIVTCCQ